MTHMERIGVRELRQNASRYLRRVQSGESFEITDRGRRIAILSPAETRPHPLADLIASGRVSRLARGVRTFPTPLRLVDPDPLAGTRALAEERAERLP